MLQVWSPSTWGKKFTGHGSWTLSLKGDQLNLITEGQRYQLTLQDVSPLIINQGIFWTDITLYAGTPQAVIVDGIPNKHGMDILLSITAVIERKRLEEQRRDEDARRATRQERFLTALPAIQAWRTSMMKEVHQANARKLWITQEQTQRFLKAKPQLVLTETELVELLDDLDIQRQLGNRLEDVKIAVAIWRADLPTTIARRNEKFTKEELDRCKDLFDLVESQPLTNEQARAVVCFDNRVQVVASAGSGKTSTMVAKAAYAIHRNIVEPERILMLAFNDSAAKELKERCERSLKEIGLNGAKVAALTFHKFGSGVIGQATGAKLRVPSWVDSGRDIEKLSELIEGLKKHSSAFRKQWDIFRLVFSRDIPDFGKEATHEDWDRATNKTGFRTLRGEVVKSLEETVIADWLFYNGINYEYEQDYEYFTATPDYVQYQPDFYYPDIGIYHEHFALNKNGFPPPNFHGYLEGVRWKREEHARRGTTLIETTSYQIWTGQAFKKLAKELTSYGLTLNPDPNRTIPGRAPIENHELVGLFRSFICHAKSNSLSMEDLTKRLRKSPEGIFRFRHTMFLKLAESIRKSWDAALAAVNGIDFEDMLNQAAEHLEAGRWESPYDLVMVDEFQDASWARARMALALVNKPGRYLFAVGDDWQSINRFAGADVSVMTGFQEWCGQGYLLRLEQTFRCPQDLCDVSSSFIAKNPNQIQKVVQSKAPSYGPVLKAFQVQDRNQINGAVDQYLNELHWGLAEGSIPKGRNGKVSVFLLGRYKRDKRYLPSDWEKIYGDLLTIKADTIHSSKGSEADYVILPGMVRRGFPNLRPEDPVLALAMPGSDAYLHAEERRLFYVALTRARRSVAMFTVHGQVSEFLLELVADNQVEITDIEGTPTNEELCPVCRNGVLINKNGKYGLFLGCTNFPACRYTLSLQPQDEW